MEFADAGSDADEGTDVLAEAAVGFDDVVIGLFARVVAAESAVFETHGGLANASVSWQDPDGTEVGRRGCGRSGDFVQWY